MYWCKGRRSNMDCIKSVNLEIRVFRYDTEDEREKHIKEMEAEGFKVKTGEAMLENAGTITQYHNKNNWHLVSEFYRKTNWADPKYNYETDAYFF
jgi:hypothetical protein